MEKIEPLQVDVASTSTAPAIHAGRSLSVVSPFARAHPSDNYLARHYGIITETAPVVLSDVERAIDADLSCLLALADKHADLWESLPTMRVASARAGAALASVRSTVLALMCALHAHDTARMCAVIYGRDLVSLCEAFCAPAAVHTAPAAIALAQCAGADRALFQRGLSRTLTAIRQMWTAHCGDDHDANTLADNGARTDDDDTQDDAAHSKCSGATVD
nr:hypothetical protein [Pandoravirus belohorizontensis]